MVTPYSDIVQAMSVQRTIHVEIMDLWGEGCEINEVDTEHLADAYYQMRTPMEDFEDGKIRQLFVTALQGVQPYSDGQLRDGVYFTLDKKYAVAVLEGKIISALHDVNGKEFLRIESQDFDPNEFL